ncbi:thyroid transcription factor 1-associated protein 26 homolog [Bicyclus anynana]|uniref:Thyroid transcription factor 1-associated protein 26 homolog n=1 Tax=Bicyclus anynana TaxID=110368 RepID=A0ABM3LQV8_BICAN|nr:thyroid transcription factor 1-associated protein 26 homolog [Bicyclus anynana]
MEGKRDSFFLPNKKHKQDHKNKDFKKQERQNKFDKQRNGVQNAEGGKEMKEKKPFDKKTYRLKKYSKKYKLEQWEEQRKKKLIHEYQKNIKTESVSGTYKPKSFDEDITDSIDEVGRFVKHPDLLEKELKEKPQKSKDPFLKAKEQYNKVKQEKFAKQEAMKKAKEERNQKLQEYKKKKHEKFKKLSKKTKKGQPVMTGRLELLLEKIQSSK